MKLPERVVLTREKYDILKKAADAGKTLVVGQNTIDRAIVRRLEKEYNWLMDNPSEENGHMAHMIQKILRGA